MKAIQCGQLIDGTSDELNEDVSLIITEGVVEDVVTAADIPAEATIIDYSDKTIVPGLIDAHIHLHGPVTHNPHQRMLEDPILGAARATTDLRNLLAAGFTSVRDAGSKTGLGLRDAVNEGAISGPRIYTAGLRLSQTGGHGDIHSLPFKWADSDYAPIYAKLVDGVDECRKETRKRIRTGVDFIKIMTTGGLITENDEPAHVHFTDQEIQAITDEAHRMGLQVASHAQGAEGVKKAVENGVDTIEHGTVLDDEAIDIMLQNDTILVATLTLMHRFSRADKDSIVPDGAIKKAKKGVETHIESIRKAYEAGVPIALGTDTAGTSVMPHGANIREAEILVEEIGMSEMEAIQAATRTAARAIGDEKIGVLEAGRYADFVVLDEDPLESITNLRSVNEVYQSGETNLLERVGDRFDADDASTP